VPGASGAQMFLPDMYRPGFKIVERCRGVSKRETYYPTREDTARERLYIYIYI